MADIGGGADLTSVNAAIAALQSAQAAGIAYINNAARMHVADVIAGFPASSTYRGQLALVDDLFGISGNATMPGMDGTLKCVLSNGVYYWQPNGLPDIMSTGMAVTGDLTLPALSAPTIVQLTGTVGIGVTRKLILPPTNVFPGAKKKIVTRGLSSLLGTLQVVNGVTNLLTLTLGSSYEVGIDLSGGTPAWVQI